MEKILVVPRKALFGPNDERAFQGFLPQNNKKIEEIIRDRYMFIPRSEAEYNHNFKQIVPYVIFRHKNRFFVYRRTCKTSDKRLHMLFSMGIGGHINTDDENNPNDSGIVINALMREFNEEIEYTQDYTLKKLGYINDDSDSVGLDHFGIAFLIEGQSPDIKVKETHKIEGTLLHAEGIEKISPNFEKWSRIVWSWLKNNI